MLLYRIVRSVSIHISNDLIHTQTRWNWTEFSLTKTFSAIPSLSRLFRFRNTQNRFLHTLGSLAGLRFTAATLHVSVSLLKITWWLFFCLSGLKGAVSWGWRGGGGEPSAGLGLVQDPWHGAYTLPVYPAKRPLRRSPQFASGSDIEPGNDEGRWKRKNSPCWFKVDFQQKNAGDSWNLVNCWTRI